MVRNGRKNRIIKPYHHDNILAVHHFVSLQRSGHHAIMNWLFQNFDQNVLFFQNCQLLDDEEIDYHNSFIYYDNKNSNQTLVDTNNISQHKDFLTEIVKGKHLVVYNFENMKLSEITPTPNKTFLSIRDFYNNMASFMKVAPDANYQDIKAIWLDHVSYIDDENIFTIKYNNWFTSQKYRNKICYELEVKNKELGVEFIPKYGRGSSFTNMEYQNQASKMDVLNRWKKYKNNNTFNSLIDDDIKKINNDIFNITI